MTTTSLTDRYVWAVLRAIPEDKRADIEAELRATIADSIDARREAGATAEDAEREALLELGDPARLAANYADRPLHLIGPALFLDYSRLLRLLLAIVLPCVLGGLLLAKALSGVSFGEMIGSAVVTTLTVGVHLCFWITLGFALLERTGSARSPLTKWDLASLPTLPATTSRVTWWETAWSLVFVLLSAGAVVWQQYYSVFEDADGRPIPIFDPALWSFWLPYFLVLIGLGAVLALVLFRVGRWTYGLAIANAVLSVAVIAPLIWLQVTGQLLNPPFFAEFGWEEIVRPDGIGTPLAVLGLVAIAVGVSVDGFLKARRAARA